MAIQMADMMRNFGILPSSGGWLDQSFVFAQCVDLILTIGADDDNQRD